MNHLTDFFAKISEANSKAQVAAATEGNIISMALQSQVTLNISISAADPGLTIDASGFPTSGKVGVPFSGQLKPVGGIAPYIFSLTAGALPDGLTLSSVGLISGTPTASGSFAPVVSVTDSSV